MHPRLAARRMRDRLAFLPHYEKQVSKLDNVESQAAGRQMIILHEDSLHDYESLQQSGGFVDF